jgi:hypothetical protein
MAKSHHGQVMFDIIVVSLMGAVSIGCVAAAIYFTWSCCFCYHYDGDNFSEEEEQYQADMWYRDPSAEVPVFNNCC